MRNSSPITTPARALALLKGRPGRVVTSSSLTCKS
jgi:hypothetical protein